jgi:hypothetical protein
MHKVRGNYSSCTGGSSPKICSSGEGAQEKEREGQNRMKLSLPQKKWYIFGFHPPFEGSCTFLQVFFSNLTLFWTKLRVMIMCFLDFTETKHLHCLTTHHMRFEPSTNRTIRSSFYQQPISYCFKQCQQELELFFIY